MYANLHDLAIVVEIVGGAGYLYYANRIVTSVGISFNFPAAPANSIVELQSPPTSHSNPNLPLNKVHIGECPFFHKKFAYSPPKKRAQSECSDAASC